MALTEKSFNQVKNILNRLDRSIDDLRARRGTPQNPGTSQNPPPERRPNGPTAPPAPSNQNGYTNGNGYPPTPPAANRPGSQFGKATPILPKHG
ncbi:MAG: hypothetical protein FJ255_00925 [Phycisphaerae bacterium]|nr:hypothetical protein [Phycisphaerae bacterium]